MDHHCPWINTCCGHFNHANFTYFLLFAPIGCIHAAIILICSVYRALNWVCISFTHIFLIAYDFAYAHVLSLNNTFIFWDVTDAILFLYHMYILFKILLL